MLLDQLGIAVFVEDDAPVAALERIERKVYLVDGEIGDAAGSEDDDLISAGHQADELGVARDDELQIPADATSDLTGSSVQCQHVLVGQHAVPDAARRAACAAATPSASTVVRIIRK